MAAPKVSIAALTHDFRGKRSTVMLTWDDDPERRLAMPVPFGCSFDDLPAAAAKALRELGGEIAGITLKPVAQA